MQVVNWMDLSEERVRGIKDLPVHLEVSLSLNGARASGCCEEYRPLIFRGHSVETPKPAGSLIDGPSKPIYMCSDTAAVLC